MVSRIASILTLLLVAGLTFLQAAPLTLSERVEFGVEVELFYDSLRQGGSPVHSKIDLRPSVKRKMTRMAVESHLLTTLWNTPVTQDEILSEIDRIIHDTKNPAGLNALLTLMNRDPFLFGEIVVRPILTSRRARTLYGADRSLHSDTLTRAEHLLTNLHRGGPLPPSEKDHLFHTEILLRGNHGREARVSDDVRYLDPVQWDSLVGKNATWSLRTTTDAAIVERTLLTGGDRAEAQRYILFFEPFDTWIESQILHIDVESLTLHSVAGSGEGAVTSLSVQVDCTTDVWHLISTEGQPDGRDNHTAIWTGAEMIIWGGYSSYFLHTGGRYDPTLDLWTATSYTDGPTPRQSHRTHWTGREMVVWGGKGFSTETEAYYKSSGARYDPATDTWSPTSLEDAPESRASHFSVWTGTHMLVWGGWNGADTFTSGGIYDPLSNTWQAMSEENAPPGRNGKGVVWTGTEMILWGGYVGGAYIDIGGRYNPATDEWITMSAEGMPGPRSSAPAFWTGSDMLIWGGWDGTFANTGYRYSPEEDTWTAMAVDEEVEGRNTHDGIWTGSEMIVWGGYGDSGALQSGARYDPSSDTWSSLPLAGAPTAAYNPTAVWTGFGTGSAMIVWGGMPHSVDGALFQVTCPLEEQELPAFTFDR